MLNQLICQLKSINSKNIKASDEEELVYQALAQCCLKTGKKAPYFQFEYQKHLVLQARLKYPDYSYVRLSIVTGINRRTVAKILKGKAFLHYADKVDLLRNYLITYCQTHNTKRILKKGLCDSFEYYCKVVANGTLTPAAMASELINKGHISDNGRYYTLSGLLDKK